VPASLLAITLCPFLNHGIAHIVALALLITSQGYPALLLLQDYLFTV
jgi:hypothetical protein